MGESELFTQAIYLTEDFSNVFRKGGKGRKSQLMIPDKTNRLLILTSDCKNKHMSTLLASVFSSIKCRKWTD